MGNHHSPYIISLACDQMMKHDLDHGLEIPV